MSNKKIYRSRTNKKLAGVCGGIAEYAELDPTIIRVIWAIASLLWGFGLLAYLVCALIIPNSPDNYIESN